MHTYWNLIGYRMYRKYLDNSATSTFLKRKYSAQGFVTVTDYKLMLTQSFRHSYSIHPFY